MATGAPTSATTSTGSDVITLSVTTTSVLAITPVSRPSPRTTYRHLLRRGLGADEAANLTAFLCGIPVGAHRWELKEINRLLFLRELHAAWRFGDHDGALDAADR